MTAMHKPIQKDPFLLMSIWQTRPEAERRLLLAPGGDEDRLLRPHVRDLTSHPSSANNLSHYPKYKISLKLQIKNSINLICSSRWQFCCTNLLRNESKAS